MGEEKKEIMRVEQSEQTAPLMLRPMVKPDQLIGYHQELTDLIRQAMKEGKDYGKVPGTDRPTLLKPGAERLAVAFGCSITYQVLESEVDHDRKVHWQKYKTKWVNNRKTRELTEGDSLGLYRYIVRCSLVSRQTGAVVGEGIGSASSMESKYIDRPRDLENTVLKMAQKRALVAAVLNTFGLSDRFTQDVEDMDLEHGNNQNPSPPRNTNANHSRITMLWGKAKAAGVDADTWKEWLADLGITKDKRTQTAGRLTALEKKIQAHTRQQSDGQQQMTIDQDGEIPPDPKGDLIGALLVAAVRTYDCDQETAVQRMVGEGLFPPEVQSPEDLDGLPVEKLEAAFSGLMEREAERSEG